MVSCVPEASQNHNEDQTKTEMQTTKKRIPKEENGKTLQPVQVDALVVSVIQLNSDNWWTWDHNILPDNKLLGPQESNQCVRRQQPFGYYQELIILVSFLFIILIQILLSKGWITQQIIFMSNYCANQLYPTVLFLLIRSSFWWNPFAMAAIQLIGRLEQLNGLSHLLLVCLNLHCLLYSLPFPHFFFFVASPHGIQLLFFLELWLNLDNEAK